MAALDISCLVAVSDVEHGTGGMEPGKKLELSGAGSREIFHRNRFPHTTGVPSLTAPLQPPASGR